MNNLIINKLFMISFEIVELVEKCYDNVKCMIEILIMCGVIIFF